ncbi:MAG: dihydrofolate reductase, partial [Prolixibacteraceae bacterium]
FAGCEKASSVKEVLQKIKNEKEAFVIGGESIYRQFYPLAGKLYLTLVHKKFDADTFFPEINYSEWHQVSREDYHDEKNDFDYSYIDLIRDA